MKKSFSSLCLSLGMILSAQSVMAETFSVKMDFKNEYTRSQYRKGDGKKNFDRSHYNYKIISKIDATGPFQSLNGEKAEEKEGDALPAGLKGYDRINLKAKKNGAKCQLVKDLHFQFDLSKIPNTESFPSKMKKDLEKSKIKAKKTFDCIFTVGDANLWRAISQNPSSTESVTITLTESGNKAQQKFNEEILLLTLKTMEAPLRQQGLSTSLKVDSKNSSPGTTTCTFKYGEASCESSGDLSKVTMTVKM